MKSLVLVSVAAFTGFLLPDSTGFIASQKKFPRVNAALNNHAAEIEAKLETVNLAEDDVHLLLVAYKTEKELQLYVKSKAGKKFRYLKTYDICALSGKPGPKRQQGDGQMPEGFYTINRFHPTSLYHLSLGLNYPNQSDRILSDAKSPGGDIFIHGRCVTIGCLPMTDPVMEEIYLFAVYARENGQEQIPVYIFPARPNSEAFMRYQHVNRNDAALLSFWDNLNEGHKKFTTTMEALNFTVSEHGKYVFK